MKQKYKSSQFHSYCRLCVALQYLTHAVVRLQVPASSCQFLPQPDTVSYEDVSIAIKVCCIVQAETLLHLDSASSLALGLQHVSPLHLVRGPL